MTLNNIKANRETDTLYKYSHSFSKQQHRGVVMVIFSSANLDKHHNATKERESEACTLEKGSYPDKRHV